MLLVRQESALFETSTLANIIYLSIKPFGNFGDFGYNLIVTIDDQRLTDLTQTGFPQTPLDCRV